MALFYRKDDYLTGSFPRKGGLIARNTAADSLCGRVALNSGKPASGARNIHLCLKAFNPIIYCHITAAFHSSYSKIIIFNGLQNIFYFAIQCFTYF